VGIINEKWSVIEINPPYSIDSWEISLPEYFLFCQDACRYIRQRSALGSGHNEIYTNEPHLNFLES
jgi:hypothetical protein